MLSSMFSPFPTHLTKARTNTTQNKKSHETQSKQRIKNMVFSISTTTTRATSNFLSASPFLINLSAVQHNASFSSSYLKKSSAFTSTSISFSDNRCYTNNNRFGLVRSRAAKHQSSSVKKQAPGPTKKKKNKKRVGGGVGSEGDEDMVEDMDGEASPASYRPSQLPKPPAGFVLDPQGRVIMASSERIATIVDSTNNLPLECIIRRVFRSSRGDECMLLCPVDTPVQILKSTNIEGWSAVSDEEIEAILPAAAYALSKIHMHLVSSGFCYTARGGFCYSEEDIFEFGSDDGQDVDGLPTQGVEITCFHSDGAHYMIYTPSDPLLFVAMKDQNGQLQIADDDLLEDPAIIEAIDEETEFNALVEEEAILLESLIGKR